LTFIEDGNRDLINNKINFKKQKMLSSVIRNIQRLQRVPYNFSLQVSREKLRDMAVPLDEDELFDLSLKLEERKAE
jgi:son of sevenless-like protein